MLIKHGHIRGFMPGMTMPFKVRDATLLASKAPGDLVTARLMVGETEAWLATLDKTGAAPVEDEDAAIPAAAFVTPLKPGDLVPDASLTDAAGRQRSLRDWQGRPDAITFITITHNLRTAAVGRDGRVVAMDDGSGWTVAQVLADLRQAAR